ncbi:MAG: LysM peptidoglycan-binding domain-containing protein, partial [Betaproteobacteria bacterium]|nr:LysM peptidoglycan-binding domain-containing protein [Betaproteobacteria bacterium]
MKFRLLALFVILGLMLITAGCGPTKRSAPIRDYSPAPQVTTEAKKSKTSTSATAAKSKKKTIQREVKTKDGEYRVKSGDTLYSISMQFGVDHNDLARLNKINDQNVINVGQILQ